MIDGAVNGIGRTFRGVGGGLRKVQTGLVRNYALAIVLGAVLLLVFVVDEGDAVIARGAAVARDRRWASRC